MGGSGEGRDNHLIEITSPGIAGIMPMTKKVIYRNRMKGKIHHLNEVTYMYYIFFQISLE